jgi:hypothetical protein
MTCAASDERTALDPILARPLAAHAGDERRVAGDDDVVAGTVGSWHESGVEPVETFIDFHGVLLAQGQVRSCDEGYKIITMAVNANFSNQYSA